MENGWSVEVTLKVKGPKEGAVVAKLAYEDTTQEMAQKIQNDLGSFFISLNQ